MFDRVIHVGRQCRIVLCRNILYSYIDYYIVYMGSDNSNRGAFIDPGAKHSTFTQRMVSRIEAPFFGKTRVTFVTRNIEIRFVFIIIIRIKLTLS